MSTAVALTAARITGVGSSMTTSASGYDAAATIEANDTRRQIRSTTSQSAIPATAAHGDSTRNAPNAVATPLPPRNLSQIG